MTQETREIQTAWEKPTSEDVELVTRQLGRKPSGLLYVAVRCAYGHPQVIVNYPVRHGSEPVSIFPTLFWLSCPFLRRCVSQVESQSVIRRLEMKYNEDSSFAVSMDKAHREYAALRSSLVADETKRWLENEYPHQYRVLTTSGIAGIRDWQGMKCLHAHLADFLVRAENPAGLFVYRMLKGVLVCFSGDCEKEWRS